uniref:Uncharacterized protein n=1 Tax=Chromera velia CCMP2878 TaxID=1169474 RepID=A0A0G4HQJ7_9ALVE|eukprot:Cvel_30221.t1-p1 / transcript=Cvel_30221.t1 / gene=Cvel_30221 / organism=Chromera_velia_CCMP2878 / gene_product=hypothetical protein / transcript_product=hypothetical protein / location=Cvel_scaffold4280:835-9990(-) / protein_length=2107 / sequence_SO=supercontig / SO=protein_coding / is_pseudo=false
MRRLVVERADGCKGGVSKPSEQPHGTEKTFVESDLVCSPAYNCSPFSQEGSLTVQRREPFRELSNEGDGSRSTNPQSDWADEDTRRDGLQKAGGASTLHEAGGGQTTQDCTGTCSISSSVFPLLMRPCSVFLSTGGDVDAQQGSERKNQMDFQPVEEEEKERTDHQGDDGRGPMSADARIQQRVPPEDCAAVHAKREPLNLVGAQRNEAQEKHWMMSQYKRGQEKKKADQSSQKTKNASSISWKRERKDSEEVKKTIRLELPPCTCPKSQEMFDGRGPNGKESVKAEGCSTRKGIARNPIEGEGEEGGQKHSRHPGCLFAQKFPEEFEPVTLNGVSYGVVVASTGLFPEGHLWSEERAPVSADDAQGGAGSGAFVFLYPLEQRVVFRPEISFRWSTTRAAGSGPPPLDKYGRSSWVEFGVVNKKSFASPPFGWGFKDERGVGFESERSGGLGSVCGDEGRVTIKARAAGGEVDWDLSSEGKWNLEDLMLGGTPVSFFQKSRRGVERALNGLNGGRGGVSLWVGARLPSPSSPPCVPSRGSLVAVVEWSCGVDVGKCPAEVFRCEWECEPVLVSLFDWGLQKLLCRVARDLGSGQLVAGGRSGESREECGVSAWGRGVVYEKRKREEEEFDESVVGGRDAALFKGREMDKRNKKARRGRGDEKEEEKVLIEEARRKFDFIRVDSTLRRHLEGQKQAQKPQLPDLVFPVQSDGQTCEVTCRPAVCPPTAGTLSPFGVPNLTADGGIEGRPGPEASCCGEARLVARFPPSVLRLLETGKDQNATVGTNAVKFADSRIYVGLRKGTRTGWGQSNTVAAFLGVVGPGGAASSIRGSVRLCSGETSRSLLSVSSVTCSEKNRHGVCGGKESNDFVPKGEISQVLLQKGKRKSPCTCAVKCGSNVPRRLRRDRWASLHWKGGLTLEVILHEAEDAPVLFSPPCQTAVPSLSLSVPQLVNDGGGMPPCVWGPVSLCFPDARCVLTRTALLHMAGRGKWKERRLVDGQRCACPVTFCVPVGDEGRECVFSFSLRATRQGETDTVVLEMWKESGEYEGEIDIEVRGGSAIGPYWKRKGIFGGVVKTFSFLHPPVQYQKMMPEGGEFGFGRPVGESAALFSGCDIHDDLSLFDLFGIFRLEDAVVRARPLIRVPSLVAPQWPQWGPRKAAAGGAGASLFVQTRAIPLGPFLSLAAGGPDVLLESLLLLRLSEKIKIKGYVLEVIFGSVEIENEDVLRFWVRVGREEENRTDRVLPPLTVRFGLEGGVSLSQDGTRSWMVGRQVSLFEGILDRLDGGETEDSTVGVELFGVHVGEEREMERALGWVFSVPGGVRSSERLWMEVREPRAVPCLSVVPQTDEGGRGGVATFEAPRWSKLRGCLWKENLIVFEEFELFENFRLKFFLGVPDNEDSRNSPKPEMRLQILEFPPQWGFTREHPLRFSFEVETLPPEEEEGERLRLDSRIDIPTPPSPAWSKQREGCEVGVPMSETELRLLGVFLSESLKLPDAWGVRFRLSVMRDWKAEVISVEEGEEGGTRGVWRDFEIGIPDLPAFIRTAGKSGGPCTVVTPEGVSETPLRFSFTFPPLPASSPLSRVNKSASFMEENEEVGEHGERWEEGLMWSEDSRSVGIFAGGTEARQKQLLEGSGVFGLKCTDECMDVGGGVGRQMMVDGLVDVGYGGQEGEVYEEDSGMMYGALEGVAGNCGYDGKRTGQTVQMRRGIEEECEIRETEEEGGEEPGGAFGGCLDGGGGRILAAPTVCTFEVSFPQNVLRACSASWPPTHDSSSNFWDSAWSPLCLYVFDETGGDRGGLAVHPLKGGALASSGGLRFVPLWGDPESSGEVVEDLVRRAEMNEGQRAVFRFRMVSQGLPGACIESWNEQRIPDGLSTVVGFPLFPSRQMHVRSSPPRSPCLPVDDAVHREDRIAEEAEAGGCCALEDLRSPLFRLEGFVFRLGISPCIGDEWSRKISLECACVDPNACQERSSEEREGLGVEVESLKAVKIQSAVFVFPSQGDRSLLRSDFLRMEWHGPATLKGAQWRVCNETVQAVENLNEWAVDSMGGQLRIGVTVCLVWEFGGKEDCDGDGRGGSTLGREEGGLTGTEPFMIVRSCSGGIDTDRQ